MDTNVKQTLSGSRRRLLGAAAGALAAVAAGRSAAVLPLTPSQTRGPFYPLELPLDSDNDLVHVGGRSGVARGEITDIFGQVQDAEGRPLAGITVEIWQCDALGRYHHPGDRGGAPDADFQGYGRQRTAGDGGYRFRTIKPVPYPGRTPHIHFALSGPGVQPLVTQMYLAGEPRNRGDSLFNALGQQARRVLVELVPATQSGALHQGRFDIVLRGV